MGSSSDPPGSAPGAPLLLEGAVVQQARGNERALVLKVREPGVTTFVVAAAGRGVGIATGAPPRPDGAQTWRKLEGFRVAWVTENGVGLARGDERARIDAARGGGVEVEVGREAWTEAHSGAAGASERERWLDRGGDFVATLARDAVAERRAAALAAVKRATTKLARRAEAVRGDIARMGEARVIAEQATWLVAEAARAPRGARSLKVTDWSSGEAKTIEVPLDPSKPARMQIDAMFKRARRLKLGAKTAGERLAQTEAAVSALAAIAARVAEATEVGVIDDALAEARAVAPKDVKLDAPSTTGAGRAGGQKRALPFRAFHARAGSARILVGRGAPQNDVLTFQVARPHDLWLHAKARAGAHVIVPLAKNQSASGDVLADAAHLAAHFSEARDEAVVDVEYTPRRYLRKPRGSPPGFVVVDREKVIAVRIDPAALKALLESEDV